MAYSHTADSMLSFSGALLQPAEYNNIGVVVLDTHTSRVAFGTQLAKWGCSVVVLHEAKEAQVLAALNYLYRYAEKLILVGFTEDAITAVHVAEQYPFLDALLCFDPAIYSSHFERTQKISGVVRIFSNEQNVKRREAMQSYHMILQELQKDSLHFTYNEKDLLHFESADDSDEYNELYHELQKIVQFI